MIKQLFMTILILFFFTFVFSLTIDLNKEITTTDFSNCDNNYYASDILNAIYNSEDYEGQSLLDLNEFKGLSIRIVSPLYSSYNGAKIIARNWNGIFELDDNALYSSYPNKPWTHPRTLSDGSRYTPLPEDFFNSFGEYVRYTFEHEACHEIVTQQTDENLATFEMRLDETCTFKESFKYRRNCNEIGYDTAPPGIEMPFSYHIYSNKFGATHYSFYTTHLFENFKVNSSQNINIFCQGYDGIVTPLSVTISCNSQNSICSQFSERFSNTQIINEITKWKNGTLALKEIVTMIKEWKSCR